MIKYQGQGDSAKVDIRIYGDGVTRETNIDLSKPPFEINFKGYNPKNTLLSYIKGNTPIASVGLQAGILNVMFQTPPPAADFNTKDGQPFMSFEVQFVYGTDITKEEPA